MTLVGQVLSVLLQLATTSACPAVPDTQLSQRQGQRHGHGFDGTASRESVFTTGDHDDEPIVSASPWTHAGQLVESLGSEDEYERDPLPPLPSVDKWHADQFQRRRSLSTTPESEEVPSGSSQSPQSPPLTQTWSHDGSLSVSTPVPPSSTRLISKRFAKIFPSPRGSLLEVSAEPPVTLILPELPRPSEERLSEEQGSTTASKLASSSPERTVRRVRSNPGTSSPSLKSQ